MVKKKNRNDQKMKYLLQTSGDALDLIMENIAQIHYKNCVLAFTAFVVAEKVSTLCSKVKTMTGPRGPLHSLSPAVKEGPTGCP